MTIGVEIKFEDVQNATLMNTPIEWKNMGILVCAISLIAYAKHNCNTMIMEHC